MLPHRRESINGQILSACKNFIGIAIAVILMAGLSGCAGEPAVGKNGEPVAVRLGYFPNITHAQALLGVRRGDFQKSLGPDIELIPQKFGAGPSIIEAVYAGHLDIAYVGPSPILNGYIQSKGEEVRVISGSAINGVLVIGNKKRGISTIEQLKGKRIATPQYANTQDISAKYYLTQELGAKLKSKGGETDVIPLANPDIETVFAKNQIDAAWVPEPWGSRILHKGLGVQIVEEKDLWPAGRFSNTNVIARRAFLEKYPQVVSRFLEAHVRITRELQADPQAYAAALNDELKKLTTKALPPEVVEGALTYTGFEYEISADTFKRQYNMAHEIGLYKEESINLDSLIAEAPLKAALSTLDSGSTGTSAPPAAANSLLTSTTTIDEVPSP